MDDRAYSGLADPEDTTSEYNRMAFVVRSMINRMATCTMVRIVAVHAAGELAPVGFVDINPLVATLDGDGTPTPHGTIHNVPYFRMQGGTNAVIIDPVVGDLGIAVFAHGDISSVKSTKAPGNPGSRRRNSHADALYIGGVLNGTPEQYIRFSADGVEVKGTAIKLIGPVEVDGPLTVKSTIAADLTISSKVGLSVDGVNVVVP